jgi:hypothetical protein
MPSSSSGGSCSISCLLASRASAIRGCSRTGSARRSSGGAACCFSSREAPPGRCLLTPKRLQRWTSRRWCVRRASVGGCPGWKPSAASPTSSPGGCSHRAGILPNRTAGWADRWANHIPLSGGEHVGGRTCAGRRTLSVHLGVLSSLLPGLGWPPLGVSHPRLPPGSVLRDVC